jgi:hypothetical protein
VFCTTLRGWGVECTLSSPARMRLRAPKRNRLFAWIRRISNGCFPFTSGSECDSWKKTQYPSIEITNPAISPVLVGDKLSKMSIIVRRGRCFHAPQLKSRMTILNFQGADRLLYAAPGDIPEYLWFSALLFLQRVNQRGDHRSRDPRVWFRWSRPTSHQ